MPQDTPRLAYLRDRPFLLVQIYRVPARQHGPDRIRTERKGWMNNPANVSIEEYPQVVDRVSDKHLVESTVIIDLVSNQIIKNSLSNNEVDVSDHFRKKYADMVERGRNTWIAQAIGREETQRRAALWA